MHPQAVENGAFMTAKGFRDQNVSPRLETFCKVAANFSKKREADAQPLISRAAPLTCLRRNLGQNAIRSIQSDALGKMKDLKTL